jgi:hypothetical protein
VNTKITGKLTSRIEKREKNHEIYYYGFFQIPEQNQEIPVIFKGEGKHSILIGSQVELTGTWANSNKDRPSFTCQTYQILTEPPQPTLQSLQKEISALIKTSLEKKQEWTQRTDFLFRKQKELQEIKEMAKLGPSFLQACLLTKQAFYANYQTEHLEQANFSLETYLGRIASELERESQYVKAYQRKEVKHE